MQIKKRSCKLSIFFQPYKIFCREQFLPLYSLKQSLEGNTDYLHDLKVVVIHKLKALRFETYLMSTFFSINSHNSIFAHWVWKKGEKYEGAGPEYIMASVRMKSTGKPVLLYQTWLPIELSHIQIIDSTNFRVNSQTYKTK